MKRLMCLFLLAALVIPFAQPMCAFALPSVSAQSAVLMDARDGAVLYEQNADHRLAMASTTKIMTALVAIEHLDTERIVRIPRKAVGIEGSSAYLYEGECISVRDLLFALLLQSANDAACALALTVCESETEFADLMNARAHSIGMTNTQFVNPHGLPAEEHYSCAIDLARLMQEALTNETFCAITAAKNHTTAKQDGGTVHYFRNHNRLLNFYPDCIGGKTGFTKAAGRCLVSAARRETTTLVCVTLSAPDDWNDHQTLFDYGFSLYRTIEFAKAGELSCEIPVVGSRVKTVCATNLDDVRLCLQNEEGLTVSYEVDHFVYAPVCGLDAIDKSTPESDGLSAGYAVISQHNAELLRIKLYYETSVEDYSPPTLWERILQFFGWKKSESKSF